MTIAVATAGSGPDVVLLHGWGMHRGLWGALGDALARDFRVHRIDLPGHGESGDGDWSAVDAVVDALRAVVPASLHLVGWSLGALLAMAWAASHPAQVKRLVLIGATPCFVTRSQWGCAMQAVTLDAFGEEMRRDARQCLRRFLGLQVAGAEAGKATLASLRQALEAAPLPRPAALAGGLNILRNVDLRASIPRIHQPVLVVSGARDRIAHPAAAAWLCAHLPAARALSLPEAGHAPFLSHSAQVSNAVSGFLHE